MKKNKFIKNPELFQGEKNYKKNKAYFEGWYYKLINDNEIGIAFIPGICINDNKREAFIQIITNKKSYYIKYNINDFSYSNNDFYVKIGNSIFTKNNIHIDIDDNNINIYGDIYYDKSENIKRNIMGPFAYLSFLECNHAIICMKSNLDGYLILNNKKIHFDNGIGYIEKDWGCSFPKKYLWCQANNFKNKKTSFMLSIADVPLKNFLIKGIICSLIIDGREYRFATYNNSKILKYEISNNSLNIVIKKGKYTIEIKSKFKKGLKLKAPIKGNMDKNVFESISETIKIILKYKNKVIYIDNSKNCGLEIVKK